MKKHLFTVRWEREGTRAYPTFEAYLAFDWPEIPMLSIQAAAKVRNVSVEDAQAKAIAAMPKECQEAMQMLSWAHLRARYSPETEGPYMIADPDDSLTEELILTWVAHAEPRDLKAYRV